MSAPARVMPRPRLPTLASPYKGLLPYTESDAQFFFGRDTDTDIIAANLISSRLTLLYGPSGVGKSSVLRAGVVNTLQRRTGENLVERGSAEFVVVYFNNWRDNPIPGLIEAAQKAVSGLGTTGHLPPTPADLGQGRLLEHLQTLADSFGGDLLIILDQFEEFFLYHARQDGEGFAVEFPQALNHPALRANFLLSFREDALAKLDFFQGYIPNLFKNYLRIKHLDLAAGREAIRKPLERYNALYSDLPPVTIEPALEDTILRQVQVGHVVLGEVGRGEVAHADSQVEIETPYLQLVLTSLWERERMAGSNVLHLATLQHLGGAQEIVRSHLQHAINSLSVKERSIAASIFDRLVTPSGSKIAQTARDLAQYASVSEQALHDVLERLASGQNRILRPVAPSPDRPDAPRYEIFHDVLSSAILEWRAKYEQEQKDHAAEVARQIALKEERQRTRRVRFAIAGIVLVLVVILGLLLFGFQQNQEVVAAKVNGDRQAATAKSAQNFSDGLLTSIAMSQDPTVLVQTVQAFSTNAAAGQTQIANTQVPDKQNIGASNATAAAGQTRDIGVAIEATQTAEQSATSTPTKTPVPPKSATSAPTKSPNGLIYLAPTLTGSCGSGLAPENFILDISFPQVLKDDERFDIRA